MGWIDSYDEREEYLWTVHNLIPSTGGMWGQSMFTLKYTSCEDPTKDGCGCTVYNEKNKETRGFSGIDYALGGKWSEIMRLTDESMMSDEDVDIHM
jgi:hypothetical protein